MCERNSYGDIDRLMEGILELQRKHGTNVTEIENS